MFNPQIDEIKNIRKTKIKKQAHPIMICYNIQTKFPIELTQVQYTVNIKPGVAVVQIDQIYSTEQNKDQCELEYLFTIDQNSAVTKMIVELGDQKVYGVIKELEEAKIEYQKGINEGKTMVLSEEDSKISNIKKVKIGCLSPGKSLKIQFEYIQPLQVFLNQFWKLELSPMVDVSYLTVKELENISQDYAQQYSFVKQYVDTKAINLNYKQIITININMEKPITYAKSPTHSIMLNYNNDRKEKQIDLQTPIQQLIITLNMNDPENMEPNKKFELLFSSNEINTPFSMLSHTNNDALQHIKYCATLTLIPKFNEFPIDDAYQSYLNGLNLPSQSKILKGSYIFFIDRSGSMGGVRIQKAKQSLILFLKSLPEDCSFNIISFGSDIRKMFNIPQAYNQQTLNQAIQQVQEMDADLGGTDIFKALVQGIYDDNYQKIKDYPETINAFLLTDGEDSPNRILELVQENQRPETRIYTLGIGNNCSEYLVQRLAEVGNGKCQLVGDNEDINSKVIDLLEDSLTQYLKGFALEHNIDKVSQIIPDPKSITQLKKNQELTLQILFSKKHKKENLEFKINCYDPQMNKKISFEVKMNLKSSIENEYFHKMAAHRLIRYYEKSVSQQTKKMDTVMINQKCIKDLDIINLSLQNQILCSKTAFICEVCQDEKNLQKLIKKKLAIEKRQYEDDYDDDDYPTKRCKTKLVQKSYDCQNQIKKIGKKSARCSRMKSDISRDYYQNCSIENEDLELCNYSNVGIDLEQPCCLIQRQGLELRMNSSESLKKDQKQPNKFLPKQSIQCFLRPKIIYEDTQKLSYLELIDCIQANGCFLLEIHIEEQLKLGKIDNKYHIDDPCWSTVVSLFYLELFCQGFKSSWQLIYNKAINYLQKKGVNYFQIKTECISDYGKFFRN
ncbi:unnamed protein product [Paramecium octaurelia]|uniref:Uncharacterized protein n=1 Tax=Paramecium octaurelia TaxID=43137 RepID=A0A8S1V2Z6_PAROT|nr:unnamed protein product [Paramecium octaurelia]